VPCQGPVCLGFSRVLTRSATASSDVGAYSVTPGGLTSTNYTITFVDGTLDITPAALSVTTDAIPATVAVDHFTKIYGSANPGFRSEERRVGIDRGPRDRGG